LSGRSPAYCSAGFDPWPVIGVAFPMSQLQPMGAPPAILAAPPKMDIESSRCKISILFQSLHASSFCLASQATLNPKPRATRNVIP